MAKTYQEFLKDGQNELHTAEYLFEQIDFLTAFYDFKEFTSDSNFTLSVYDKNVIHEEPLYEISGLAKDRIPLSFVMIDAIFSQYFNKPTLSLVN